MSRDIFNYIRLLRALSNLTLNVPRDRALAISLGNPFVFHHPHRKKFLPYIQFKSMLSLSVNTSCTIA